MATSHPDKRDYLSAAFNSALGLSTHASPPLREYLNIVWPVVNPGTPFTPGLHIDAMCEHLEAVYKREIRNLAITVAPRHTKSFVVSVAFPTWTWTMNPALRFVCASYRADLSIRDAVHSRRIIEGEVFRSRWPNVVLTTDQNVKTRYENSMGGARIAVSVGTAGGGGGATGEGGDFTICDDPHDMTKIASDTSRQFVIDWYKYTWSSRLNDQATGCRVLVMQRGHMKDLVGELLEQGGWEHLNLPTEFDPKRRCFTSIGWRDPRTEPGELLCPARFGPDEVARAKAELGEFGWASQHQQYPVPYGGGLFKRSWFEVVAAEPTRVVDRCRAWDCAATVDGGDWTVGTLVSLTTDGWVYVEDVIRVQVGPGDVDKLIIETAHMDGLHVRIFEEVEAGSAGKAIVAQRARKLGGYAYHAERPTGAKQQRWQPFATQAQLGNVRVVKGAWNRDWFAEVCAVPNAAHDDQADSVAYAYALVTARAPLEVWGGDDASSDDESVNITVNRDASFEANVARLGSYFPGD